MFFDNAYADPTQSFKYDPTYRLTEATGREHAILMQPTPKGFAPIAHPQDIQAQRRYTQAYAYDPVGNITRMTHKIGDEVDWARGYAYAPGANKLLATSLPGDKVDDPQTYSATYSHDTHGNMTAIAQIPGGLTWDHDDRLQASGHLGGGTTYYVYDGAGQRVRKVHVNQAGTTSKQRLYFGAWETYREHKNPNTTPTLTHERETLHIHDDHGRICLIETKTVANANPVANPANIARYQFSNHLGTANLELDDNADVITYEEFHPYGTSSYRAANSAIDVSPKRYRYTGQERDEETGLAYHSARYYAPWLARWTAADPLGLTDGPSRYAYTCENPANSVDRSGTRTKNQQITHSRGDYSGPTSVPVADTDGPDLLEVVKDNLEAFLEIGVVAVTDSVDAIVGPLSRLLHRVINPQQNTSSSAPHSGRTRSIPHVPQRFDPTFHDDGVVVAEQKDGVITRTYSDHQVSPETWSELGEIPGIEKIAKKHHWARREVIEALEKVGRAWASRHPDRPIQIGDISKKGGGPLSPHKSHQAGVDVDVRAMSTDPKARKTSVDDKNYSRTLTRDLIDVFDQHSGLLIEYIWFADEALANEGKVDLREDHRAHFHVRFFVP